MTKDFIIEKDSEEQEKNPEGEKDSDGKEELDSENQLEDKKLGEYEKQLENKTPIDDVKDSLANLKLPFTGVKNFSIPYFWINLLILLVVFAIYKSACRKKKK